MEILVYAPTSLINIILRSATGSNLATLPPPGGLHVELVFAKSFIILPPVAKGNK